MLNLYLKILLKILCFHGILDPMVPKASVDGFLEEMEARKANYEFTIYGGCYHAFTRPDKNT